MSKKEPNGAKGSKKPGQGRKKFSKGFVQGGMTVQFYKWGTKKIVLKTPVNKG